MSDKKFTVHGVATYTKEFTFDVSAQNERIAGRRANDLMGKNSVNPAMYAPEAKFDIDEEYTEEELDIEEVELAV